MVVAVTRVNSMPRLPIIVVVVGLPFAAFCLLQLGPIYAAPWAGPYLIYTLYVGYLMLPAPRR